MMATEETLRMINHTIYKTCVYDARNSDRDGKFLYYNVTIDLPPKIVSDGIWGNTDYGAITSRATMPLLELQIITIFIITQFFHFILKRLGFPFFVSQMMAGFVLGPTLKIEALNQLKAILFPYGIENVLNVISGFGYLVFLFLNGVKMDFSMITRTGKKAWTIALASLMIPMLTGLTICYNLMSSAKKNLGEFDGEKLPVIVINHSGCSFPVVASLLSDLEILNSELGRLALSSALVMDVVSQVSRGFGTAIVSSLKTDSHDLNGQGKGVKLAFITCFRYIFFITSTIVIARPAMRWIVRKTPEGKSVKKTYTSLVILMAVAVGLFGFWGNQTVLGGVLLMGLLVPEGPPLGSELVKQLELFNITFLTPVFVTCCAMKIDMSTHINTKLLLVVLTIVVVVHLIKVLLTVGICGYCNMPKTDGLCLALMLSCKGVVDFVNDVFLYDSMLMSDDTISMMAISALVLGITSRIGVKYLYDPARKYAGYQKRNILSLKPNSEFRIVACIHKPSHIMCIRNVLEICCPTVTNPLVVHVLHLMELVGRSSPIFISHRHQERTGSGHHYSEDVIVTFDLFEHDSAGSASVNTYTAISPLRFMHDDISYLALDKLASIILLPFHVRWDENGGVESSDKNIRALNCKVLERAPCSVGILVNRGSGSCSTNNGLSMKQIAVIFIGGADDREAMCLAKRTIKDSDCNLIVYHLVSSESEPNWDLMLDDEVLKSVKGYYGAIENVSYEKIAIDEPCQTSAFVSCIAKRHDFFIVGRRDGIKSPQTAALDDWTEFPELGVVGDLLASPDTNTNASILVVQQQQLPKSIVTTH